MSKACEDQWRRRAGSSPFSAAVALRDDALVLGRGTILRSLGGDSSDAIAVRIDAGHDRMVALLATAAHGRLSKHALLQVEAALGDWRRGDRGLAAIRLAFARLPRKAMTTPTGFSRPRRRSMPVLRQTTFFVVSATPPARRS